MESHYRLLRLVFLPHLDGPIARARQEEGRIQLRPPRLVDRRCVSLIRRKILLVVRAGAAMDAAVISRYQITIFHQRKLMLTCSYLLG